MSMIVESLTDYLNRFEMPPASRKRARSWPRSHGRKVVSSPTITWA